MSNDSLKFHIKSDDYFGTLATILSLVKQTIGVKKCNISNSNILEKVEEDLMFLQKEYKIIKK